jgi:hypothetical protein
MAEEKKTAESLKLLTKFNSEFIKFSKHGIIKKSNASRNYLVINKILDNVKNKLQKKIVRYFISNDDINTPQPCVPHTMVSQTFLFFKLNSRKTNG